MNEGESNIQTPKIFNFEDASIKDVNERNVGRKGLSLFKLVSYDVPVPDFFVISPEVFKQYASEVLKKKSDTLLSRGRNPESSEIVSAFLRSDFEKEFQKELLKEYTKISGFTDSWVSVRSSVSYPLSPTTSFSGVFSTQLNVRGFDSLKKAIKQVYASLFTDSAVSYALSEGIELSDVTVGVVVQKMVQAETSGVTFTIDPITQDLSRMNIEAVFGLGDVIANGEITPDSYTLLKKDLSILEKQIAPQEWMKVRTLGGKKENVEKIHISKSWSHRQKLEDKHIDLVAKIALIIENQSGVAQDVEWVLSGGRVWVLQNKEAISTNHIKPITYGQLNIVSANLREVVTEFVTKGDTVKDLERKAVNSAQKQIKKEVVENVTSKPEKSNITPNTPNILSGIGASFGQVSGKVVVISSSEQVVAQGSIIVLKEYEQSLRNIILASSGVICELGGLTSDLAILCRESNIPAIVGVHGATEILKDGSDIQIDGNSGAIYLNIPELSVDTVGVAKEMQEKLTEKKVEEVVQVKEEVVVEVKDEASFVFKRDSTLPNTATKIFVDTKNEISESIVNADGILFVDMDLLMLEDGRHPLAYVEDGKYKEYAEKIGKKIEALASVVDTNEIIVSLGSQRSEKFKELTRGASYEGDEKQMGVSRYIEDKKLMDTVFRIIRRVRNVYMCRNVSLAFHYPSNGANMREIKKYTSSKGLRRSGTFNIYAVIDSPSEVILTDEILDADIDGLIVNTPSLAKYMQNISHDDDSGKYNLGVGSVLKVVDTVISAAKKNQRRVFVVCEDEKEIIKHSVKSGVYGISVFEKEVKDIRKLVADTEAKIILGVR